MLQLSEIFCSIQGESSYSGLPCIFIRLAGCNLRCNYCDTSYSYTPQFELSVQDILQRTREFYPIRLVEITGGEPLLQNETYALFDLLHENGYQILLETNGSQDLSRVPDYVVRIVDVKCPGSNHSDSFLLSNIEQLDIARDELKFVITDKADYDWALQFINNNAIISSMVLFSVVSEQLSPQNLAAWLIQDRLPYRMQLQLHKYIWDPHLKGV